MTEINSVDLGSIGKTYPGLSGKTKSDFGSGSKYIPYLNIFKDGKIDATFWDYVRIGKNEKQYKIKYGDLFFTTSSETIEEVGMTSVLLDHLNEDAYLNSFCFGFRLNNFDTLDPQFARFLFRSSEIRKRISNFGQGSTRYNLPKTEMLRKLILNLPPIPIQQKIAKILSTIDGQIEKTEAIIAKYQAVKQGMLQDLFTRGIDVTTGELRPKYEHAPELYKDSLLGMIPKEWEVEKLKNLTIKIGSGVTPTGGSEVYTSQGILFIRSQNVLEGELSLDDVAFISTAIDEQMSGSRVLSNDVLLNITGASIGRCSFYPDNLGAANVNQHVCIIRFQNGNRNLSVLATAFMNASFGQRQIFRLNAGGNREGLNYAQIGSFDFPVIGNDEVRAIAYVISNVNKTIGIEKDTLAKQLLLKQGVMSDLLSGKLEVKI